MRNFLLFVALVCLGLQAQLLGKHEGFGQVMFGQTEDMFVFVSLGAIEALIIVIWAVSAAYETSHRMRDQRDAESWAEIGQTSKLPRIRGEAIGRMTNSLGNRAEVAVSTFRRFGLPFLMFAIVFCVTAALIANLAIGSN